MADPSTYRPAPGEIPVAPGVYRFRDVTAASSTWARPRACGPGCRRTSRTSQRCTRAPRPMVTTAAQRRVDRRDHRGRGAAAGVLLDQGVRPAVQREVPRRQVLPVPCGHPGRGVPARAGHAGPSARARGTSARTRTPGPSARRSTCCCASSRCAPAAAGCSTAPPRSAGRACSATSASAPRPASAGSSPDEHRAIAEDFCDFIAGHTERFVRRLEERDAGSRAGAGLRARRAAARRHRGARTARWRRARWCSATAPTPTSSRWPRTSSRPRSRSSTSAAGGSAASAAGSSRRSRRSAPATWSSTSCSSSTASRRGRAARGAGAGAAAGRRGGRRVARGLRGARVDLRVPQRGDKRALLETVERNAGQALALHKTKRAGDLTTRSRGAGGAPGGARPRRRAAAHRVLRRVQPAGHRGGRVDGRLRGRAGAQVASTAASRSGFEGRTTSRPCARSSAAGSAATSTSGSAGPEADAPSCGAGGSTRTTGRPRKFAYPPQLVVVDGGRRRSPPPRAPSTSSASTTSPCAAWPNGWRRSGCPTTTTRSSCHAPARASTCCSACATRRTGSRSPTTGSSVRSRMTASALDGVPGLGEARRRRCSSASGRSSDCGAADVEEIAEVPGVGPRGRAVVAASSPRSSPAVDPTTGEILVDAGRRVAPASGHAVHIRTPEGENREEHGECGHGRSGRPLEGAARAGDHHRHVRRRADAPPRRSSRTSAGSSSTTSRRSLCCSTWSSGLGRSGAAHGGIAVVVDVRSRRFFPDLAARWPTWHARRDARRMLFLEASDEALVRRFEVGPPAAPAAGRRPASSTASPPSAACSRAARQRRPGDRHHSLNVHELRAEVAQPFADRTRRPAGHRHVLRLQVRPAGRRRPRRRLRFLPNPHWVPELRPRPAVDEEVRDVRAGPGRGRGVPRPLRAASSWSRPATGARASAT